MATVATERKNGKGKTERHNGRTATEWWKPGIRKINLTVCGLLSGMWADSGPRPQHTSSGHATGPRGQWLSAVKPSERRSVCMESAAKRRQGTWRPIIAMSAIAESRRGDDRLMERSPEQPDSVYPPPGYPSHRIEGAPVARYYIRWREKTYRMQNIRIFVAIQFLADRTATHYDRLLASSCRPSVCPSVCL